MASWDDGAVSGVAGGMSLSFGRKLLDMELLIFEEKRGDEMGVDRGEGVVWWIVWVAQIGEN